MGAVDSKKSAKKKGENSTPKTRPVLSSNNATIIIDDEMQPKTGLVSGVLFLGHNKGGSTRNRSVFQFYPMVNLWYDIQTALNAGLKLVHLAAEPISVADISVQCFGKPFKQVQANSPATYDFRTLYANTLGGTGHYQYSQRESILAVRAYAQSEPITLKVGEGKSG